MESLTYREYYCNFLLNDFNHSYIQEHQKKVLPDNYHSLDLMNKLRVVRSEIPAITHVDFSARIQTVDGVYNPEFKHLLEDFKARTGVGMLINTSFNVRGEPIVCTPEDAYRCFMRREMEFLQDLWTFIKERKKWWLLPMILILLTIGTLLVFAESSAVGSFIYTLF